MKTILFICVGNAARSQMAEAFFNLMAEGKARAISAGTEPITAISPVAVSVMREIGIDISHQQPKQLTTEMIEPADRVVSMGCGVEETCTIPLTTTEDWGLKDPKGKPIEVVREAREQIQALVVKLLAEIV